VRTIEAPQYGLQTGDFSDQPSGGCGDGVEGDAAHEQERAYSLATAHEGHYAEQRKEVSKYHSGATFGRCDVRHGVASSTLMFTRIALAILLVALACTAFFDKAGEQLACLRHDIGMGDTWVCFEVFVCL